MLKKVRGGLLVGLGYMLSPLSWWNDLFFNLPIAYAFGYAVKWFAPGWFLPGTIIGYWLSNVLGIVMMQFGATDVLFENKERNLKRDLLMGIGTSTLYTIVVAVLVYFHILETPAFLVAHTNP
jgi:cation transport ATPase